jgi:CheY-like chemotaxis protein
MTYPIFTDPAPGSPSPAHTLLYIEDDPANAALMRCIMALRPAITLLGATAGRSGVALAQEQRPNLVLLDFHLPDMNGDQVLERLLGDPRTAEIPVVVLSGDATPGQIDRLLALGARRYVTKPFNVRAFLDSVDDLLSAARR